MNDDINYSGYASLIWIRDRHGKEFACSLDSGLKDGDLLTDEQRAKCLDVNTLIGTERW